MSDRKVIKSDEMVQALKKITYGFYILTSKKSAEELSNKDDENYAGGLVCWVSQCSFDPPMVTVAVQRESHLNRTIAQSKVFALNIVGKAEKPMLAPFSKRTEVENARLNGYKFEEGKTGSPILVDVPAFIECQVSKVIDVEGDHVIYVGEVVHAETRNRVAEPLIEWETDYHYGG